MIYAKIKNLHAIQLLLGYAKLEGAIECLDVEIEDALRISESCETEGTSMQCPECKTTLVGIGLNMNALSQNKNLIAQVVVRCGVTQLTIASIMALDIRLFRSLMIESHTIFIKYTE